MASPFLTARWRNLALVTYRIDPKLLDPVLPPGCEADLRDGDAFVSLVAFDFLDTEVAGIRWPGFVDFPEVNLRAYVRREDEDGAGAKRGVAFIREFVPQTIVALAARALYNEPYSAARMDSDVSVTGDDLRVWHRFDVGGARNEVEVLADPVPHLPPADSTAHFFKEHDHGFGTDRRGRRVEYRVHHRTWRVHEVRSHRVDVDFGATYGKEWAFLTDATPASVVLAEGSGISVHQGVTIDTPARS